MAGPDLFRVCPGVKVGQEQRSCGSWGSGCLRAAGDRTCRVWEPFCILCENLPGLSSGGGRGTSENRGCSGRESGWTGPGVAWCPEEEEGWGRGRCLRGRVPPDTSSEGGVLSCDNGRGTQEEREPPRHSGPQCRAPLLHRPSPVPVSLAGQGQSPCSMDPCCGGWQATFKGAFLGSAGPLSGLCSGLSCADPATGHAMVGTVAGAGSGRLLPLSDALIFPGEAGLGLVPLGGSCLGEGGCYPWAPRRAGWVSPSTDQVPPRLWGP